MTTVPVALYQAEGPQADSAAAAPPSRQVPASFAQASLWFVRQIMPYPSAYNTAIEIRLEGELDAAALLAAVRAIVDRHESFRTTFTTLKGTVLQVITEGMAADVASFDLTSSSDPTGEARRLGRVAAAAAFDLERGPLLRVHLFKLAPGQHALVVVMDHIIADGMSLGILWREIEALYRAHLAGEPSPLPPAKQFAECVEAQNRWLTTPTFARQLGYWTTHLAGAVAPDLPEDKPRPPVRSYRGDLAVTEIPAALTASLRALSVERDVSLFASLLAGLDVLLARYSGQGDIVVMVPIACRQRFGAEAVIGFFANMVVLRTEVPDDLGFGELVRRVNKEIMAGVFRQDVPFEKVVGALRPERSLSHDPLARVALSFLPAQASALDLPGVQATYREIPSGGAKFDLHLVILEHEDHLSVSAEYNGDIFEAATMEALLEHYRRLLASAGAAPDQAVADLPMLAPAERQRILVEWNETAAPYPREATLPTLFAGAVARSPAALAASFEGREITYEALDRRSNQVARALRARGVEPGVHVGIALDRSLSMVVGLLGILKAGGAYVPLDPAYPHDRLSLMAEDSALGVLLTEDRFADIVPSAAAERLRMDRDAAEIDAQSFAPLDVLLDPEAIAYVIYTSGSTGRPKGVQIPHRALVNFLATMAERPGLSSDDRVLAVTSLSFDIAGLELWLPLTCGAHVEIASRETAGDGGKLRRILDTGRITVMQATPSTFRLLIEAGWTGAPAGAALPSASTLPSSRPPDRSPSISPSSRSSRPPAPSASSFPSVRPPALSTLKHLTGRPPASASAYPSARPPVPAASTLPPSAPPRLKVLIGGEATPRELADQLLDRAASVWNMYGPTETTIWSCIHPLQKGAPVLIGRPIANTRTYVLDRHLAPVPAGLTGELYIGGDGLARGYLGRPELTSQRFVPDPFGVARGAPARLYRTGDLCRQHRDGTLEFCGRIDFQVKLRGHRIELGEIEATLAEHPALRQAIVVVHEETPGDQKLIAYLTLQGEAGPSGPSGPAPELLHELRALLRSRLPEYMVPARFVVLDTLPLTANNKIDRKSLPPPPRLVVSASPSGAPTAAGREEGGPRGALELQLLAIWEEILGTKGIGLGDSFFDVGGHSLLALKLFDRIEESLGVKLPVASLFRAPTIAEQGELLRGEGWAPSWSSLVPIQTAGSRAPLYCVHAVGGNVLNYRLLSWHLGDDQPFYGLQARGLGGDAPPHATVEEMAAGYLDEIRQEQPRGPYLLGGASSGGVVAYEMAQQLRAAGERVPVLVMLDTYLAGPPTERYREMLAASPLHGPGYRLDYHVGQLLLRSPRHALEYLTGRLRKRFGGVAGPIAAAIHAASPAVRHVIESNLRALAAYEPQPYSGRVEMLLSRDEPERAFCDRRLAWADLVEDGLSLRYIPGNHDGMLEEPQVATVAAVLARCLGRATGD